MNDRPAGENSPEGKTLYALLFHNSFDGLLLTAPDGRVFDANPAACRILGRTRDEILEVGRTGVVDTTDPRLPALMAERERTGSAHGELTLRRKDGTLFPIEISSVVFHDAGGELRTCMIIRDITERKAAENERERLIGELREALEKVKTLSGLLPMCSQCRKIRDAQGHWHPLEVYVREHTHADFTHGICPDCRRELYPETLPK